MKNRTIYHQSFFEMIPEQIEYTLYHAMESVLAISTFEKDTILTDKDKSIVDEVEPDGIFEKWNEFSNEFKQNIINEAIDYGQTDGYDSGVTYTYTDEVLERIKNFWNKGGALTVEEIKSHMEWLWNTEVLDKAQLLD